MPDAIEKFIDRLAEAREAKLRANLAHTTSQTDSPIEALFAAGLMMHGRDEGLPTEFATENHRDIEASGSPPSEVMWLCPQAQIGPYRVDFLCMVSYPKSGGIWWKLAVECDGHNYHDVTVEQASRDRARDRYLQDQRIAIYRFTGTDLNRDLYGCAKQTVDWAWEKLSSHFNDVYLESVDDDPATRMEAPE